MKAKFQFSLWTLLIVSTLLCMLMYAAYLQYCSHAAYSEVERLADVRTFKMNHSEVIVHPRTTDKQFARLSANLWAIKNVKTVDLSTTQLSDQSLKLLTDCPDIEFLRLDSTNVTDSGMEFVLEAKTLRRIWINESRISGEGLAALAKLPRLSELKLDGRQCAELCRLNGMPKIRSLILTNTQDYHLEEIGRLESLRTLVLTDTNITDASVPFIERLSGLEILNLDGTSISDQSIPNLAQLENLEWLSIAQTKVSSKGIQSMRRQMRGCSIRLQR